MIISKGEKRTKLKKPFLPKTQRAGSILEAAPKKTKQAGENKHKSEQNTRKIAMSAWPGKWKTSRIFRNTRGELGSG